MTITATAPAVTTTRLPQPRGRHAAGTVPAAAVASTAVPDSATLLRWGFAVENDGIAAHEDRARAVADAAAKRGLKPVLIDILSDTHEPAAARTRAFGRLAFALTR